jgi:hypothetical protein
LRQGLGFQQTSTAKRRGLYNKQTEEKKSTRQNISNLKQLQEATQRSKTINKGETKLQ